MKSMMTAAAAAMLLVGCATATAPPELINAQTAYQRASQGPAATRVPDELHRAKVALDTAQQAYGKDPNGAATRDLAYVAERKAELAEAKAQVEADRELSAKAANDYTRNLAAANQQSKADAERARAQANEAERQRQADASSAEERVRTEQRGREAAERRADAASQDLARIAQLREEERGLVLTFSGDVLFATDQSTLLPSAGMKLDQLAAALNQSEQKLTIEGHTDSRGSDAHNQDLSYKRAGAVRDYLIARGISPDRLQAAGYGKTRPIADNTSPEGRAQNRRVEIIIEAKSTARR